MRPMPARNMGRDDRAFFLWLLKDHFAELFCAPHIWIFHKDRVALADLRLKMFRNLRITCFAKLCGAGFDILTVDLGHPCCGCAFARGIGKDMQPRQIAVLHQLQRVFKMRLCLRWKACDDIGTKCQFRT